ncbi:MAG: glycosyltransferase family 39 protein [Lachnospiraceae bacterium]|nr:glycosyltransferase family 39 protein [Lachnospiraceae bacterium]
MKLKKSEKTKKELQKYLEILYVLVCAAIFFTWSLTLSFDRAPDEMMRYQIPQYIFSHGALPSGNDATLRNDMWGFSYAYYPTFIGPIFSALFMKIASFFSSSEFILLVAARFTSVISGTATIWFLMKSAKRLFKEETKWFIVIMLSMLPQFVYLSSYVNNDIICICGSAIMVYAWICGLQDGWNYKNGITLAAGIVIAALSYYNSYGWILSSILIFGMSYLIKSYRNTDFKKMFRIGGVISAIVLVCVAGFFIRNAIIYQGDFLGMKSLTESSQMYALDWLKPTNRNIAANHGDSVWQMLISKEWTGYTWADLTFRSFIGTFGYMQVWLSVKAYWFYLVIFAVGILGFLIMEASGLFRHKEKDQYYKGTILLKCGLTISFVIPIALSIYYSYAVDYEPQGRYCYPMVIALMCFLGYGYDWIMKKIPWKVFRRAFVLVYAVVAMGILAYAYTTVVMWLKTL